MPGEAQICLGLPGLSGVSDGDGHKTGQNKEYDIAKREGLGLALALALGSRIVHAGYN